MTSPRHLAASALSRRRLLAAASGLAAAGLLSRDALAFFQDASQKTGVDPAKWNTETIQALAGTIQVDTAAELTRSSPRRPKATSPTGRSARPRRRPTSPSATGTSSRPPSRGTTRPSRWTARTSATTTCSTRSDLGRGRRRAGRGPDADLWGVEFAAKGQLQEVNLEEFGLNRDLFWDGALKSVTWEDKLYGIPTNNETMAFHLEQEDLRRCRARS
jgi:multiple sugar transport system substrate-binding protein